MEEETQLARWEHLEKDEEHKTHLDFVPYIQLSDKKKDLDREPVRAMPGLLA